MATIYLEKHQVPDWLRGSGNRYEAEVCERVTVPSYAGLWEGGSRSTYAIVRLSDGASLAASDELSAPWDSSRIDREIALEPGIAVVRHCVFSGKRMPVRFYVHPSDAAALLPPPVELSDLELLVLRATRSYKASYGGRDRYQMACDDLRWDRAKPAIPSRAQWDEAKAGLVSRGYLTKAGAITVAGRNAVA